MGIFIAFIGLMVGFLLNGIINKILVNISQNINDRRINILAVLLSGICFFSAYIKLGLGIMYAKAVILASILIIISFIDLRTRTIPDYMVAITLATGIIFSFLGGISFLDSIFGMIAGGGALFLLALVPNAMGGGDIKLMFALGAFLGLRKTLWAIVLAFIAASIISLILLMLKVIGRKDHIPFGPFLALGSFISLITLI